MKIEIVEILQNILQTINYWVPGSIYYWHYVMILSGHGKSDSYVHAKFFSIAGDYYSLLPRQVNKNRIKYINLLII